MTFTLMPTHDVFVAHPATLPTVRRALQNCLPCSPFDGDDRAATASLGRHAMLHAGIHGFSNDMIKFHTGCPVKLTADFPVWVSVRGYGDEFEQEAAARRVYQVLANQQWPVVLVYDFTTVLATEHCDKLGAAYPITPLTGGVQQRPPAT